MAVRGVLTTLVVYPEIYDENAGALYRMQNYFVNGRTIYGLSYTYNFFQTTPLVQSADQAVTSFSIDFGATASNVAFVEEAVVNRYSVLAATFRWSDNEGLEDPSNFNVMGLSLGYAASGSSDFTSVTLTVSSYDKSVEADFPGRKIPWTILAPLSLRR